MALGNNTGNSKFITVVSNQFCYRLPEGQNAEEAVERTLTKGPNAGKTVKELHFDYISGMLEGGDIKHGKYGSDLVLNMKDGEENYKVQIPLDSGLFGQVVKRLENIDRSQELFIGIGTDTQGAKPRPFIFMKQGGQSVKMKYTRDEPNGMPGPVEKVERGQTKLDWVDQENFLYDIAVKVFGIKEQSDPVAVVQEQMGGEVVAETEDIPF